MVRDKQFEVTLLEQNFRITLFYAVCRLLFALMVNFETWDCAHNMDALLVSLASLGVETIVHYRSKMFLNEVSRICQT